MHDIRIQMKYVDRDICHISYDETHYPFLYNFSIIKKERGYER